MRIAVALAVVVASLIGLAALLGGATAIGEALFQQEDRQVLPIEGEVRRVEVEVSGGQVDLRSTEGRPVLSARRAWVVGEPDVDRTLRDGTLVVRAGCDGWTLGGCEITLDLAVPEGVPVRARVRAGGLSLRGTLGTLRLDVAAGGVELDDVASRRIEAKVSAGGLDGRLTRAPRLLDVTTTAGGVDLDLPGGRYAVSATTTAGGVDLTGIQDDPRSERVIRITTTAGGVDLTGR
jgi:hypothetical protein